MINYQSAVKRISNATTKEQLDHIGTNLGRAYHEGQLTETELMWLCDLVVDRVVAIQIIEGVTNGL